MTEAEELLAAERARQWTHVLATAKDGGVLIELTSHADTTSFQEAEQVSDSYLRVQNALSAVLAVHKMHVCVSSWSTSSADRCVIMHGGDCAQRGKCSQCLQVMPCGTHRAAVAGFNACVYQT